MIPLKRLNGTGIWLNPLMIESIERTPDTIVTLANGHKYVIYESPEEIATLITKKLRDIGLVGGMNRREDTD